MDDREFFYAVYISAALGAAIAVFLTMKQYQRDQRFLMIELMASITNTSRHVSDTGTK